jgi:hypothetical protein
MNQATQDLLNAAKALQSDDEALQVAIAAVEALPETSAEEVVADVVTALEKAGYTVTPPTTPVQS